MFRGIGVAIVTPFSEYQIDFKALAKVLDHCVSGGVDYIVSLGSTGESATLSAEEKRQVLDFTIDFVKGRTPIIAGNFGGNHTKALCDYIDDFNFKGVDAILSSSPSYNKPSQEGLFQHYSNIAAHSPRPVIVYNVPSRTSSNITAETTVRIAKANANIIGIKEASADLDQCSEIINNTDDEFLVLSGDDPTALETMRLGGDGVISVIANALPSEFSKMTHCALSGDFNCADKINNDLNHIHPLLYAEGNPAGVKGALDILGLCSGEVRLPLTKLSDDGMKQMRMKLRV